EAKARGGARLQCPSRVTGVGRGPRQIVLDLEWLFRVRARQGDTSDCQRRRSPGSGRSLAVYHRLALPSVSLNPTAHSESVPRCSGVDNKETSGDFRRSWMARSLESSNNRITCKR